MYLAFQKSFRNVLEKFFRVLEKKSEVTLMTSFMKIALVRFSHARGWCLLAIMAAQCPTKDIPMKAFGHHKQYGNEEFEGGLQ